MALVATVGGRAAPQVAAVAINLAVAAVVASGLVWRAAILLLLVPLVALVLRRPQNGVLLLAALVPLDGLLELAGDPGLLAGWKEALLLVTLAAAFLTPRSATPSTGREPVPHWWLAVAGLAALSLVSAALVGGWHALVGFKILFFFSLVAVVVWHCPLDARDRDRLVTILIAMGGVTAAVGVAQFVAGPERLHELGYEWNSTIRTTGGFLRTFSTFNQPFGFGFFLVLVLLVGLPHALEQPARLRSRVFLALLPLLVSALATTFVRGAWLALTVGLAYLGITRYRVLLAGLALGGAALLVVPQDVSSAALSSRSGAERVWLWQEKASALATHPLGAGIGASGAAAEKAASFTGGGPTFQPDNHYLKIAYELGPLGLWLLVLLLAAAFHSCRVAARDLTGSDAVLARSVGATVLAAAAASSVATYFEIFPMDLYFWLLLGVVSACRRASS